MYSPKHDARWGHKASILRYRKLLDTHLTETERRFIERRLAEEQQACRKTDPQERQAD
jgi:hypothetical protein